MIPMINVKTGDRNNPPFLNASPIARIPHPTFPFNMFTSVSE